MHPRSDDRAPCSITKTPLRNRRSRSITLRLEPWGEELTIAPNTTIQLVAKGPAGDELDIRWEGDTVTVYGWPGSVVSVLRRGAPVGRGERKTAPFLPDGMRMSEWMAALADVA